VPGYRFDNSSPRDQSFTYGSRAKGEGGSRDPLDVDVPDVLDVARDTLDPALSGEIALDLRAPREQI